MPRVQFSADGISSDYELSFNPVQVDLPSGQPSTAKVSKTPLEGESITFEPYLDTRRHKLIWRRVPYDGGNIATILNAQWASLLTYVDTHFYIHLQDIGTPAGVFDDWVYVKGISLDKTLDSGGRFIYSEVVFMFELAEE